MHPFPESLIDSTKNGTEKDFSSQWLSTTAKMCDKFQIFCKDTIL